MDLLTARIGSQFVIPPHTRQRPSLSLITPPFTFLQDPIVNSFANDPNHAVRGISSTRTRPFSPLYPKGKNSRNLFKVLASYKQNRDPL